MGDVICSGDIHRVMVEAGEPCFKHETDLYVFVNPTTTAIINRYQSKSNVIRFRSQHPEDKGAMMYDIPFAWMPSVVSR